MDVVSLYRHLGCDDVLAKNLAYIINENIKLGNHLLGNEPDALTMDLSKLHELSDVDDRNLDLVIKSVHNIPVYETVFAELSEKYNFPHEHLSQFQLLLNLAAYIYLSVALTKFQKTVLSWIEAELVELQNAADRFSYALKPLMSWEEGFDMFFDNFPVQKTLSDTKSNLDVIMSLKEKLRSSTVGDIARLGDHRPIGNPEFHQFIKLLWELWHDLLGRTIVQKYDGINGRKQFLEFLIDCLEPIHPSLEHGTVDNALKKFQKSLK